MLLNLFKQGFEEIVCFQKMTEIQNGSYIGNRSKEQIEIQELLKEGTIIDLLSYSRVRKTVPLLEADDFEHLFQRHFFFGACAHPCKKV